MLIGKGLGKRRLAQALGAAVLAFETLDPRVREKAEKFVERLGG